MCHDTNALTLHMSLMYFMQYAIKREMYSVLLFLLYDRLTIHRQGAMTVHATCM